MNKSELNKKLSKVGTRLCTVFNGEKARGEFQCSTCLSVRLAKPANVLKKPLCGSCSKAEYQKTQRPRVESQYRMLCSRKGLRLLQPYQTALTKVKHLCLACRTTFEIRPNDVKTRKEGRNGCPVCGREAQKALRKPLEHWISEIENKVNVTVLGDRQGNTLKCRCLVCKAEFRSRRGDLLSGHGCRDCGYKQVHTSRWRRKPVVLGNRIVYVQGFEPQAIQWLLSHGVSPQDICVSSDADVPVIPTKAGKHYPDLYVKSLGLVIEVKSTWTFGLNSPSTYRRVRSKAIAAKDQGYDYRLWLMAENGDKLTLPSEWWTLSRVKLRKQIDVLNRRSKP